MPVTKPQGTLNRWWEFRTIRCVPHYVAGYVDFGYRCCDIFCTERLKKGGLSIWIEDASYADDPVYFHPACVFKSMGYSKNANERATATTAFEGFSKLRPADKKRIEALLQGKPLEADVIKTPLPSKITGQMVLRITAEGGVQLHGGTYPLKDAIKAAGASWDAATKCWTLPSAQAAATLCGIDESRVVDGATLPLQCVISAAATNGTAADLAAKQSPKAAPKAAPKKAPAKKTKPAPKQRNSKRGRDADDSDDEGDDEDDDEDDEDHDEGGKTKGKLTPPVEQHCDLSQSTTATLGLLCKHRGVPCSGTKQQRIDRLIPEGQTWKAPAGDQVYRATVYELLSDGRLVASRGRTAADLPWNAKGEAAADLAAKQSPKAAPKAAPTKAPAKKTKPAPKQRTSKRGRDADDTDGGSDDEGDEDDDDDDDDGEGEDDDGSKTRGKLTPPVEQHCDLSQSTTATLGLLCKHRGVPCSGTKQQRIDRLTPNGWAWKTPAGDQVYRAAVYELLSDGRLVASRGRTAADLPWNAKGKLLA